jgi:predicted DNA-binding protein YlxM (UPF0122 family)
MSAKLGTVLYGSEHSSDEVFLGRDFSSGKNYSEKTAAEIDDEIRAIISDCYERCRQYLTDNIEKLHFVAEFLLKNESMDDEQFKAAMETDNPTIEDIEKIAVSPYYDEDNQIVRDNKGNAVLLPNTPSYRDGSKKYLYNPQEGGWYNSLARIENWLTQRITFLDSYFNYNI